MCVSVLRVCVYIYIHTWTPKAGTINGHREVNLVEHLKPLENKNIQNGALLCIVKWT